MDVVSLVELPARMERREDQLERALLVLRVHVHRDAAPVVGDLDLPPAFEERHFEARRIAVDDLVDRVVDDLVDEMMEAARVDAADVHARALADGLEPFQDGDGPPGGGGGHQAGRRVRRNPDGVKRVPFPDAGHDLRPGSTARAAAYRSE